MSDPAGSNLFIPIHQEAIWQAALNQLPNAHALQSWTWGALKADWGWSMHPYLLQAGDGSPLAALLVLKRKVPRLPFAILYVPKGPAFDYDNTLIRARVLTFLERLAHQEKAIFVKIDPEVAVGTGAETVEPEPAGSLWKSRLQERGWRYSDDQIQFKHTVELDLAGSEEEILASFKQKTRYNIRLAGRKAVAVREGTPTDFPAIARIYAETARRDGFAIRPEAYYLDAWQRFYEADMLTALIAEYESQILGAVVLISAGGRTIYMYGASTTAERRRMPNYLLQWEAIRWAKRRGDTIYDFWGAPEQFVESDSLWGVWRFKAGFNGDVKRFLGAWDYPARPFWYWVYTVAMPRYLDLLRSRNRALTQTEAA